MEVANLEIEPVVGNAGPLREWMTRLLETSGTLTLDLRWVQRVDVAGLQLLLALSTSLENRGDRLRLWPGPALERASKLAGLEERFAAMLEQPTVEVWG